MSHRETDFRTTKKAAFTINQWNVETAFSAGGRMLERRWKLPASSRYSFFGDIKRLVLRRIQAIKHAMVEISRIEALTFPAMDAGKPPAAAKIEMQEVSGVPTCLYQKKTATFR